MNAAYKNILCIRLDNMGDVLMSSPAFNALKKSFNCKLTLLTSAAGSLISPYIPCIDETIVAGVPWVKSNSVLSAETIVNLAEKLKQYQFDAAFIFTVYSQSALPAAMVAYMANITQRIAYCRENPYELLTTWLPDKEPYSFIQHQVERDLKLAEAAGANISDQSLQLVFDDDVFNLLKIRLKNAGIHVEDNYIILHPGVSEKKREYPVELWKQLTAHLSKQTSLQIIFTGAASDENLISEIKSDTENVCSVAGLLNMQEHINLIKHASVVCCVNTVTAHIAAAAKTPVVVLYALTNPQHTPWCKQKKILYFPVKESLKSKNAIVTYVSENSMSSVTDYPSPQLILQNIIAIYNNQ